MLISFILLLVSPQSTVQLRLSSSSDVTFSSDTPVTQLFDVLRSQNFHNKGIFYDFRTSAGEAVLTGDVKGMLGASASAKTIYPLASMSKLFVGFAAMCTMELKSQEFYPEKFINEFDGWEKWRDFKIAGMDKRANLTIHHLLTHTSGLPFNIRYSDTKISKSELYYEPGTHFGYTIGHRIMGWLLRDFWKAQPEAKSANISKVRDAFEWLFFSKLQISKRTKLSHALWWVFGRQHAVDASIESTGEDVMRLALVALRKGMLPNGTHIISQANWKKWAGRNLLPDGKLSKELVDWNGSHKFGWEVRENAIMKASGDYGWNYFGATYNNSKTIGWCGFFSSCTLVSYELDLAVVLMQRDAVQPNGAKQYLRSHVEEVGAFLQCKHNRTCRRDGEASVFCNEEDSRQPNGHLALPHCRSDHRCYLPLCEHGRRRSTSSFESAA